MQIFGKLLNETEDRSAILIRHDALPLLEQWQSYLNSGIHRCIIIKKNYFCFVFIICSSNVTIEMSVSFDDERSYFKVIECKKIESLEGSSYQLDKVSNIDRTFELAIKPVEWKYRNEQAKMLSSNLYYDELESLDNYEVVMEELRRQEEIRLREEEENKNAEIQLDVWTKYVKKERELLDDANRPFALAGKLPDIKKALVDIETLPNITTIADRGMLEEISGLIGGVVSDDKLEMTLEEFVKWQENENQTIDAKILGILTLKMTVECDGHWCAKEFKDEHKLGREFYFGWYDSESSSIELTYKTADLTKLFKFYERVNNSYHFDSTVALSEAKVSFSLQITTTESEEERKKRIEILSGRDFYSKPNMQGVFLGTLSKNGSDKKQLRIILPKEKEEKEAAKTFFKDNNNGLIYPGLLQDRVLLNRRNYSGSFATFT